MVGKQVEQEATKRLEDAKSGKQEYLDWWLCHKKL